MHFASTRSALVPQAPVWLRGHRAVLVDEAAKHVVTIDVQRRGSGGDCAAGHGHTEVDAPVRSLSVVVTDVGPKDSLEVTVAQNEYPIEAFAPHRSHPALGERVGPGRSDPCLYHPDAF